MWANTKCDRIKLSKIHFPWNEREARCLIHFFSPWNCFVYCSNRNVAQDSISVVSPLGDSKKSLEKERLDVTWNLILQYKWTRCTQPCYAGLTPSHRLSAWAGFTLCRLGVDQWKLHQTCGIVVWSTLNFSERGDHHWEAAGEKPADYLMLKRIRHQSKRLSDIGIRGYTGRQEEVSLCLAASGDMKTAWDNKGNWALHYGNEHHRLRP